MHACTSVTRQEDWGKGKDLRAYLKPESDASDANDGTFTSLTDVEGTPKPGDQEVVGLGSEKKSIPQKLGELSNSVTNKLNDFNIIRCEWLKDHSFGKCANCKDTGTLPYQVENTKNEYGFVCKRCGEFFLELIEKQRKVD